MEVRFSVGDRVVLIDCLDECDELAEYVGRGGTITLADERDYYVRLDGTDSEVPVWPKNLVSEFEYNGSIADSIDEDLFNEFMYGYGLT